MDTLGLILLFKVHPANVQDRDGAYHLLHKGHRLYGWLRKIWADAGYAGKLIEQISALKRNRSIELEIVRRTPHTQFEVLPKRWIVERTFAWLAQSRRLSKDYEVKTSHSQAIIYLSMTKRMLQRIV